jgi:signal transduction histidine kinase
MFQPFFSTKPAGYGTGLGLWIVRDIVERCGGGIDVQTTPGRGTAFVIYFPDVSEPAHGPPSVSSTSP